MDYHQSTRHSYRQHLQTTTQQTDPIVPARCPSSCCVHWRLQQHTDWGYSSSNADGEVLVDWASTVDATLLFDPKEPHTFYSARWNTTTNPDLAFAKWHNNHSIPVRRILAMFPQSHHRPSLITIPSLVQPVQGRDVKRWNFRKANWAGFTKQVNNAAAGLPHPCPNNLNGAYDSFCKMLLAAAKNNIP